MGFIGQLLGEWVAEADTPAGPVTVTRSFRHRFGPAYVQADTRWALPDGPYEELALFGADAAGVLRCWSFTSDGKQSVGEHVEGGDLPEGAVTFEAEMPAGLARQSYYPLPGEAAAFGWAVEGRTPEGWSRFTEHTYRRA